MSDFGVGAVLGFVLSLPAWVVVISSGWWWRKRFEFANQLLGELAGERDYWRERAGAEDREDEEDEDNTDDYRGG